jgi:spore germination protein YaaH
VTLVASALVLALTLATSPALAGPTRSAAPMRSVALMRFTGSLRSAALTRFVGSMRSVVLMRSAGSLRSAAPTRFVGSMRSVVLMRSAGSLRSAAPMRSAGPMRSAAPRAVPKGGEADQNLSHPLLQAFLLSDSPDSFADLRSHVAAIGTIYPTYFECATPTGVLVGSPNSEIDAYAQSHGLVELPRFSCQNGDVVHRILTRAVLRAHVLAQLIALLPASSSYAGLDLDFENDTARDRAALDSFVAALAARLHARHRELAVDIDGVTGERFPRRATGFYDDRALSASADTVFVMAWGTHWEGSGPGPLAPLSYVRGVARFLASLPHPHRFVLGVPLYGLDWPTGGDRPRRATALQYADVLSLAGAVGATPMRDPAAGEMTFTYARAGVTHRVWYLDAHAVLARLRIARRFGLAAGVWRLGEEDQGVWSALGA